MKKYKIGELAKTMGVSSHLLKHYEKFDIVSPIKDSNTNYRYYNLNQYNRIIQCKKYRNIGLPLKDTAAIMNNFSNEEIFKTLSDQVLYLNETIENLTRQKTLAESLLNEHHMIDSCLNQWFVQIEKPMYLLKQSINNTIKDNSSCEHDNVNLIDYAPLAKSIIHIDKESLNTNVLNYNWCIGIDADYISLHSIKLDERYLKITPEKSFVTYIKIEAPFIENNLLLNKIKEIFDIYNFEVTENLAAILIKVTHDSQKNIEEFYFKIVIPIR